MSRRVLPIVLAVLLLGPATANAVTIDDIVALSKAGVADSVLIALIDADQTVFDLTPQQIVELKRAGVSDNVVVKMVGTPREFDGREPRREPPTLVIIGERSPGAEPLPPPRFHHPPPRSPSSHRYSFLRFRWIAGGLRRIATVPRVTTVPPTRHTMTVRRGSSAIARPIAFRTTTDARLAAVCASPPCASVVDGWAGVGDLRCWSVYCRVRRSVQYRRRWSVQCPLRLSVPLASHRGAVAEPTAN